MFACYVECTLFYELLLFARCAFVGYQGNHGPQCPRPQSDVWPLVPIEMFMLYKVYTFSWFVYSWGWWRWALVSPDGVAPSWI